MLEEGEIGLSPLQGVLGLADFSGGGGALLLQATQGAEIVLSRFSEAAGFDELRVEGDNFFLGSAGSQGVLVGLRRLDLGLGTRGFRTDVRVVQLQQYLALLYAIAFFDQQAANRGGNRSVSFEIVNGLNLAIGGDDAANGTALDSGDANF